MRGAVNCGGSAAVQNGHYPTVARLCLVVIAALVLTSCTGGDDDEARTVEDVRTGLVRYLEDSTVESVLSDMRLSGDAFDRVHPDLRRMPNHGYFTFDGPPPGVVVEVAVEANGSPTCVAGKLIDGQRPVVTTDDNSNCVDWPRR